MTVQPIVFGKLNQKNYVGELQDKQSYVLRNCYVNELGHYCKRLGLTTFATIAGSKPIDGIFETYSGVLIVATNAKLYNVSSSGVATEITGSGMTAGKQVRWCEDKTYVYAFHGSYITKINVSAGTYTIMASGPTTVNSGVYIQNYLLCDGVPAGGGVEGDINYLELDGTTWSVYNQEAYPGPILSVQSRNQEVVGFEPRSIEASWNDGSTPWALVPSSVQKIGTLNGNAVVWISGAFILPSHIDNARKIIMMNGNEYKIISDPIQTVLDTAQSVDTDMYAWPISCNGFPMYVIRIKTGASTYATWVYDLVMDTWYEWTYLNGATEEQWLINSSCFWQSQKKMLIGDRNNSGIVYEFSGLTDNTVAVVFQLISGNYHRGTRRRKACSNVLINVRRGEASSGSGSFLLKWSDELGSFNSGRTVDLGVSSDLNFVARKECNLGMYRGRRWQIYSNAITHGITVSDLEEDFDYMGS